MFVDFNILNQLGSPAINSNTFANRPAAGQTGRLFVSTDTFEIYRDNGTSWDLIGGPGAGTITGTGTATQVAYFTGSQTIGSSANLFWDNTAGALGINTATPGAELDVHGTGIIVQLNSTTATANSLLAFQRSGTGLWRIGDVYNGGTNYFEVFNTVLSTTGLRMDAATNKTEFLAQENYTTGLAQGSLFTYNLTLANGTNFSSPNAIHAVNSYLNLSLGGNTTTPAGARQGLEGNTRISFTGAGTLTMTQGSTVRAWSSLSSVYSFNGSAVGTITHLAGLRVCFPDNIGSAVNITNNYGVLINDQTTGTGTVNYTNRWGIYQEGASDLNYFNGNLLIKSTTNTGEALQVTGTAKITSTLTANSLVKSGGTASEILAADGSVITAGTNITIAAGQISSTGGGISGSGTTNYLPKFTASTTVGDSRFLDDGTQTFLGNGSTNASPSTGILSATGGTGTNIAGAEFRIRGGASTGNAAGGPITFYTSAAGSSGTGVNAATERIRVNTNGELLINATTNGSAGLGYQLGVRGTNQATLISIALANQTLSTQGAYLGLDAIVGYMQMVDNKPWTFATNNIERMRLTSGGSLGIGTTTIGSTLQVNGNAAIGYSASTAAPTNGLAVSGSVGIGTTSPAYRFDVQTATNRHWAIANSATGFASFRAGDDNYINFNRGEIDALPLILNSQSGGNVGIGTTSPSGKLHIDPDDNQIGLNVSTSSLTGSNAQSLIDLAQTWNTTGNPTAIKLNITNTASGASAYLMDLQVGAATQFRVTKAGAIRTAAPTTGTANDWKLGSRVASTVNLDTSQYIELEVGGTLYRLAVVTLP